MSPSGFPSAAPNQLGDARWIVVHTKPRQERFACDHLRQRELEPYCPMFLEPPWHPRAPRGPMPLFASYVFVRSRPQDSLSAVRFCPGVLRPLSFAGRLAFVDEELIEALKLKEGDRGHIPHDFHANEMSPGRRVRIMDGPLRGVEGVLGGLLRGRQRAKVLIQFLRSEHTVEVDAVALVGA